MTETIKKQDEVAKDLLAILNEHDELSLYTKKQIMVKLIPYILHRDYEIFNHAFEKGRNSK